MENEYFIEVPAPEPGRIPPVCINGLEIDPAEVFTVSIIANTSLPWLQLNIGLVRVGYGGAHFLSVECEGETEAGYCGSIFATNLNPETVRYLNSLLGC